jgi:DNA polymerase V
MLTDLRPANGQGAFEPFRFRHEDEGIAELVDQINRKLGSGAVGLGHGGLRPGPQWQMKREMLSRRATTHWDELAPRQGRLTPGSREPVDGGTAAEMRPAGRALARAAPWHAVLAALGLWPRVLAGACASLRPRPCPGVFFVFRLSLC